MRLEGLSGHASSSADARKEVARDLSAAAKKPVRTVIGGQVRILKVRVFDSFGEDACEVMIDPAPKLQARPDCRLSSDQEAGDQAQDEPHSPASTPEHRPS